MNEIYNASDISLFGEGASKLRMTILWSSLASYSVAFFRELASTCNVEIQLIYQQKTDHAPYSDFDLSFCSMTTEDSSSRISSKLDALVEEFSPHCVLMCSWNFGHYMRIARKLKKRNVYIVSTIDHQWEGRLKQYLGVVVSPWYLKPCISTFLVAGDRQAEFARRLGYDDVMYGLYAADILKFSNAIHDGLRTDNFLFIGRLVPIKGIELLMDGYRRYREQCSKPWGLKVIGTGIADLEQRVKSEAGIDYAGFIQPDQLPLAMQQARCFILPSLWEPWGVVIHEAAASGLPIIATNACGAVIMFVRDGVNGCVIAPTAEAIASAMLKISESSDDELAEMSDTSRTLAGLWSPKMLAKYFCDKLTEKLEK